MPGLYPDNPIRCDDCGTHFVLSPGHASDGAACPECGGKRFFRDQPSPTQSDGTLRDMVDSASQKDNGGNPLGEGSIMGSPGNGTATQPAWRRDEGTYSSDGSVTKKMMRLPNMEPYMPWTHEAGVLAPLAVEGEAAALPAEVGAAGAAAGAVGDAAGAAADAGGGLVSDAWGGLKSLFGAGAKKVPGQIAGTLMRGALKAGEGAIGMGGGQAGGMAPEPVTQAPNMMSYGSADIPMLLVADLQTPTSNPSVDEDEDDPQQQDQKEFDDQSDSSSLKNPHMQDSGADGEDGVKDKDQGYGFGEQSPGLERLMMVLPLLLHYFQSPDSGEQDPIIKALHDTLEQENPGYLNSEDPEGPGMVEMIIQHHKNPQGVTAGVGPYPSGLPEVPMPGNGISPMGGGTCPTCGGQLSGDGSCPQCGSGGQKTTPDQTATPGNMMAQPPGSASLPPMMANHQGPVTPEQISAVAQLLIDQGRSGEIETMKRAPQLYQEELQQVQQNPSPVPPLVDPSQSQPPMPMEQAPGSMPVPDMGGGAGGQPMQPMAGFAAHLHEAGYRASEYGYPPMGGVSGESPLPNPQDPAGWHDFDLDNQFQSGYGNCPACLHQAVNLGGQCKNCGYRIGQDGAEYSGPTGPTNVEHESWGADQYEPRWGKTADANNRVPRCPKCGTSTTSLVSGADNDPSDSLGKCHNPGCEHIWKLDSPAKESRQVWADIPNPVMLDAAGQHSPTNQEGMNDPTMQWVDNEGNELQTNQVYELYSPAYSVPDMVRIVDVKPDAIQVQLVGMYSNGQDDGSQAFDISRHEAQLEHYEFVAQGDQEQNIDDRNTEPPAGTPGLEQVPPSGPTTDQVADSYPNTALSHVEPDEDPSCMKCGSTTVDHGMVSPTRHSHDCVRCGHYWETADEFQGRSSGVDLSWVLGSNLPEDDFNFERHQAMADAGGRSRNIGDIAAKDPRLQAIKARLDENDQARTAGRQFTHSEKRELIDEQGRARNLGDLDLSNTHYDTRVDYTGKANGENVDDSHFALGL